MEKFYHERDSFLITFVIPVTERLTFSILLLKSGVSHGVILQFLAELCDFIHVSRRI
jgi:hypothetical protein